MTGPSNKRSLTTDEIEQIHNGLVKSSQEQFLFLLGDYGFSPPTVTGFNRQTRGGSTTITYQKEFVGSELFIVVAMEYTAAWVIIAWKDQGKSHSIGLHELMKLRCPDLSFLAEAPDEELRCRENLRLSSMALHDHFKDLLQGDLTILRKKRRRKRS